MSEVPWYLEKYTKEYFAGHEIRSGYTDYRTCSGILRTWSQMVDELATPTSVLDVGAAYGFLVEFFQKKRVPAWGIDPSDWCLSQAPAAIRSVMFKGALPDLPDTPMADVVTCTEVLEHLPEELVAASLQALADKTSRVVISIIACGSGPGSDPDGDETHLTLRPWAWWDAQWDVTGLVPNRPWEKWLDEHLVSKRMHWTGRFFVRERV